MKGWIGWVLLAVYVAVWDGVQSNETLSNAFYKAWTGNTVGKVVTLGTWGVVTLHLFAPRPNDCINLLGKLLGKIFRG